MVGGDEAEQQLVPVASSGAKPVDERPEPGALAALQTRRIRRLDAVVLTHAHADYSDGLPAVLRALDVGALIVGPRPLADGRLRTFGSPGW